VKRILFVALLVLLALAPDPARAERALYAVEVADGSGLASLAAFGVTVRHVGTREALVEAETSETRTGHVLERARHVAALPAPTELYISFPRYGVEDLERVGEVLWSEGRGVALVACPDELVPALGILSFAVYQLRPSVSIGSRFDNTPPGHVASAIERGEDVVRGVVEDVMTSISSDSLMAHVERLSSYPGGEPRSRFTMREECLTEARAYVSEKLSAYLPGGAAVDTQRFYVSSRTCDQGPDGPIVEYPAENVVGVLPGTGRLGGYYIVCAHYDATASSSFTPVNAEAPFYWWCDNPAPGADDNATGVATVLEAARVLSGLTFPFDIRFALFSAEEIGIVGSGVYADSVAGYRAATGPGSADPDTIYGVLNVDMVAFKTAPGNPDSCDIVTNPGSVWFADWLVDTADSLYGHLFPDFTARRIDQSLAYSDHAPFWDNGYDGLAAIEHWNPRDRNPNYHTTDDTYETVSVSQLTSVARMVAGAMARLADPDLATNFAVFGDDLAFLVQDPWGGWYATSELVTGTTARVRADFHVFGPDAAADVTMEVYDGAPGSDRLLSSFSTSGTFGGGQAVTHEFDWELGSSDMGDHYLSVVLDVSGVDEQTLTDNTVESIYVRVNAPDLFVVDHYTWPNPARDESEVNFSYRLSRDTDGIVEIRVFDILGQELVSSTLAYDPAAGDDGNQGFQPGLNSINWESLSAGVSDLASGVYVYQIQIYERGATEPIGTFAGRFALVR
jgi:hypothetical protein